ncbi:AMIN domain-containing protein [Desulfovibrio sp. Huiquan2017]|uniref:AMIN domain-containing protein n=1 Tax=Desulfovibrio sp. Huiquan2017 TaxID=2816861 RepID=UPI001A92AE72|nr:AMIN domain-containing protein [Desulfovibrio sp. Huiquan2017]
MTKNFRLRILFLAACAMAGLAVAVLSIRPATAEETVRHEVRMDVDFTVLPIVLPDGTEAPAESTADQPEAATAPEQPTSADQATAPAPESPADTAGPEPAAEAANTAEIPAMAPVAGAGTIRSVVLDETAQGFSIQVVADRAVGQTAVIRLENPRRLVVDILGPWRYRGVNVLRSEGAVKHLVLGEHPDHFRMVVHFRTPPKKPVMPDIKKAGDELHVLVPLP